MKLRETRLGRAFLRTRLGQSAWRWAHRWYDPWAAAYQLARTYRRNTARALSAHGIRYEVEGGRWPRFIHYPPDLRLTAIFPDGEQLPIHLTEERGYEDIDGRQHLPAYRQFAETVAPQLTGAPELPVLDCACGSGYGAHFLGVTLGRPVLGLDLDEGVVRYARKRYAGQTGLAFATANATDLAAVASASVLAVVSIETIEHIPHPEQALSEFARVLAPGGALFMTTPDATERPDSRVSAFHVREFTQAEFVDRLSQHFPRVDVSADDGYLVAVARK